MHIRAFLIAVVFVAAGAGALVAGRSSAASPTPVPSDIRAVFDKPAYVGATWALRVDDGKDVLLDLNSQRQLAIGSVRKVFTVGQLINAVGASHTYDTPVYRTGSIDAKKVLHGNLIIVASGDLTMGGRKNPDGSIAFTGWDHNEADSLGNAVLTKPNPLAGYQQLARAVKAAGIEHVAGEVVIDDRLFAPFEFRDQFKVKPIFVNDDLVDISIDPAKTVGQQTGVTTRPHSAALAVKNQLRAGAAKSKDTLAVDPIYPTCIGTPGCSAALKGSLPIDYVPPLTGEPTLVQAVRIVDPSNYARSVFVEALGAAGVKVDAPAVEANPAKLLPAKGSYATADKVAQLTGMTYGDDAKLILKVSYNIGADTSLVLYGLTRHVDTIDDALKSEQAALASRWGIASDQYHFVDGSGGGDTTATAVAVVKMLEGIAASPQAGAFYAALPNLGVDGTLGFVKAYRKDPTLAGATGRVRAKTGTWVDAGPGGKGIVLKGQAFAGYITTKSGRHLTYHVVVNGVPIKSIDDVTKVFEDEATISAMLWRDF
jgi:D-alanyl-D-alanine carboxypeptidase